MRKDFYRSCIGSWPAE